MRRAGFTLLEAMAVVLLTSIVFTSAITFYRQLARQGQAVVASTADARRAAALLDRVAADLEGTVLVERPPDVDPLAHPWLFLGESRSQHGGSDHLKFDTRHHRPSSDTARESDLVVVSWWLEPDASQGYDLLRRVSPRLPDALDRDFPARTDAGVQVYAEGLAGFRVRFLADDGSWADEWDSSALLRSNKLPLGAEIEVELPPDKGDQPVRFAREVELPLRPIDLAQALSSNPSATPASSKEEKTSADQEGSDQQGGCVTVGACIARNAAAYQAFLQSNPYRATIEAVVDSIRGQCFSDHAGQVAALGLSVEGCQ